MKISKSQIIIRLLQQIYDLVDELKFQKSKVKDLEQHKIENPDSYELTLQNDKLIRENKSLNNTLQNLRNELKILRKCQEVEKLKD
jgi:hypothetical protein